MRTHERQHVPDHWSWCHPHEWLPLDQPQQPGPQPPCESQAPCGTQSQAPGGTQRQPPPDAQPPDAQPPDAQPSALCHEPQPAQWSA
jgi:hypothetical protein